MITLESDKATMEIPAPFAGVVKELKVKLDDRIAEGAVILTLEVDDDARSRCAPPRRPTMRAAPPAPAAEERRRPRRPQRGRRPDTVHASPVARRMARDLGVDIAAVEGSGRLGRVTKDDVLASAEAGPAAAPARRRRPTCPVSASP